MKRTALILAVFLVQPASAEQSKTARGPEEISDKELQGIFTLDGSFVHTVGQLQVHMTNWGLIGSKPGLTAPYSEAPSAMWPAGSGNDHLYAAGLWVGGIKNGTPLVSTGQPQMEMAPTIRPTDTIYRLEQGQPRMARYPFLGEDDDGDEALDEDPADGLDNDGDGLVDEDGAAIGDQHFRCVMRDDAPVLRELSPDHDPLGIEIVQNSFQWSNTLIEDAIGLDFRIRNVSNTTIEDPVIGFWADCDIGPRSEPSVSHDDLPGFYQGTVRGSDGALVRLALAYMYDCGGESGRSPGYLGYLFLDYHPRLQARPSRDGEGRDDDVAFANQPTPIFEHSFHYFVPNAPFERSGAPRNDEQRYEAMTQSTRRGIPSTCNRANDYRILLSFTPLDWGGADGRLQLRPGDVLDFQMAIVAGDGFEDLLANAANITQTYYGRWFDRDGDPSTGRFGRETKICQEDFGLPGPDNDIFEQLVDCGRVLDEDDDPRLVLGSDLDEDGCAWINDDCFFESLRGVGEGCLGDGRVAERVLAGCTGIRGREYNVRWWIDPSGISPDMRLWQTNNRVHVFWDSRSEEAVDLRYRRPAFEGYGIWRASRWDRPPGTSIATGPATDAWSLQAAYDVVDSFQHRRQAESGSLADVFTQWLPLGPNTGLEEIEYVPAVLRPGSDEARQFLPLSNLLDRILEENPALTPDSVIRYAEDGRVTPLGRLYPELEEWTCCSSQLDSLAWSKMGRSFYEYVDGNVHNGQLYFYAVTANSIAYEDLGQEVVPVGYGPPGSPRTNFTPAVPQSVAQSSQDRRQSGANIYVVPNPVTRSALAEFSQLQPNATDPTGVRLEFRNLPEARNTIRIFTLSGDLVQTIHHDGRDGAGSAAWNLVSRSGQEVVSGVYLYSVESARGEFERFIGRFVIIR